MYLTNYGLIDPLFHYRSKIKMIDEVLYLNQELEFYKSIMKMNNSCIYNLRIKTKNGKRIWVDFISGKYQDILELDDDEEIREYLQPVNCER